MIKPNWDIFKAKFSENPQENFEWFCYLLFCAEFNKPKGVPGYKNHRHVENHPITEGDETIGWQAKFYQTPLSEHKAEIIKLIEGARKDYPDITKIIFYTNKNWSQGRKQNDPQAKLDIDEKAGDIGIRIDWDHMENFFRSPFVCVDNEPIARHFFTFERSILDVLGELGTHTGNILNPIRTRIHFNGGTIEIDRKDVLEKLKDASSQVLVLSGTAGAGKTAVIKNLYEKSGTEGAFYVFKATEFELRSIADFLKDFSFQEFVDAHASEENKTVVIDSAEKLADLRNTDPFREFLTVLVRNNWRIIFTTREHYLNDLNYQLLGICNVSPLKINLPRLERNELNSISSEHSFNLPEDRNLLELIRTPFYLNEYLGFYGKDGGGLDYSGFKKKLWNKNIGKSKLSRSEFFLKFAFERAKKGSFFLDSSGESSIADELVKDGILGYEQDKGCFITHDIYEEWALEKKISREYFQRTSDRGFFENLGQALPVRRSFRNWMSERLLLRDGEIGNLIESVIADEEIRPFWKDETLVSVLLSDYSETLFENLGSSFLRNEQELLRRTCFLLRLACKEIDRDFFKRLGVEKPDLLELKRILTKPRGCGWESLVKFVYENMDAVGTENIRFVLPVIHDWTSNFKTGETTRYSGLIALRYYRWSFEEDHRFSLIGTDENQVLQTIVFSASEIKDDLKKVFDDVLDNKWRNPGDPYRELSETVLKKPLESAFIFLVIPESVLRLADLFWSAPPEDENPYSWNLDMESHFNIECHSGTDYYPPSPYRTPVYWLLKSALPQAVDFILEFTNKTVGYFSHSALAEHEVEEIEVSVGEGKTTKQYVCDRLWCTYRGTQASSHILESIHMALEKFFLEEGERTNSEVLESWLLYLMEKSESASISAVVASIVLAYPEKTFNVAKTLFRTKEFFRYDTTRYVLDQNHKSVLSALNLFPNLDNNFLQEERLKACDDEHRKKRLEDLFVRYQFFRSEETGEQEAEDRQKTLWDILDGYYDELPPEERQTESDKDWRLCLARMDRRKMRPTTEEVEGGVKIDLNPEVEPELRKRSEDAQKRISESFKYGDLQLWSHYKIENDEAYRKYEKYEKDPKLVLKEVKEIISRLKSIASPDFLSFIKHEHTEDEGVYLWNYSIPAKACSVLVRDCPEVLSEEEISFCKDIVLGAAASSFAMDYGHQVGDGVASAISVLPSVLGKFPGEKKRVKTILLLTLFNPRAAGMAGQLFSDYAIMPVLNLWKTSFDDAQSILSGYLLLEPEYERARKNLREENFAKGIYEVREPEVVERFLKENEKDMEKVVNNELPPVELEDMRSLDQFYLRNAFLLIPLEPDNEYQKELARKIIRVFAEKLFSDDSRHGEEKVDYGIRRDFLKRLACLVLSSPRNEIKGYMEPFIHGFKRSKLMADLFEEFVVEEDRLNSYGNFWEVWNLFKEKVIEICRDGDRFSYTKEIAKNFLLAHPWWKESATRWHALKDNDKRFFKEISQRIGHCPSVLYSISKLLDGIGSHYLDDGILWISDTLSSNRELFAAELEDGTVYHMENSARKYIYKNLQKIRERNELKEEILVLLDFLVEKGSVIGYMLRERVI